jgi:molybdopterin-guanine dinucleotide biosynthesis protein A
MRQIEKDVVGAFVRGDYARKDNTESVGGHLYLHGNEIAYRDDAGNIEITHAGWHSRTTRSRLNAVLQLAEKNARVFIKDWTMHIERDGKVEPMYERFYAV